VIPIHTPVYIWIAEAKGEWPYTRCVKAPLIAIWSTRVNHLFPLPVAQLRSRQPMVGYAVAQSLGAWLSSFTCYKRWEGGDTGASLEISLDPRVSTESLKEESKVTRAFTFNIHEHLSLVVSLESTPLDCTKYCDTVYKPLFGLLVYSVLSGPIKIIQSHILFTLFPRYQSHT